MRFMVPLLRVAGFAFRFRLRIICDVAKMPCCWAREGKAEKMRNPGYLRIIEQYTEVASLLKNPKVELYIDDGRRWLIAHPNEKFDAIVMNTTYHFREHASSLLSEDFLQIIRLHLNPGGIHYYNTARSNEVLRTGATVFPIPCDFSTSSL
ncbi:MAG TPA: hypothetical protein VG897_14225 [Terriglobales bacterium]|nr:hypothetical protein [Terriglobales bacterium]